MGKKLVAVTVAVALLGVGILVGSLVSTPPTAEAAERLKGFSPDKDTVERNVNVRPKDDRGEDLGDYFVGYGPLLNRPGGRQIGNEKHHCWNLGGTENSFQALCDATFWIEGRGKITGYGAFKAKFGRQGPEGEPALAITGGTGAFKDARGTIKLRFKRHGLTFVFDVID